MTATNILSYFAYVTSNVYKWQKHKQKNMTHQKCIYGNELLLDLLVCLSNPSNH